MKTITEELCGHSFSASVISTISKGLDETLTKFARRKLTDNYPYVILDARYVLIAIGINWESKREVLGVELANRESQTSWREFLMSLKQRGLSGVEFVVTDDHAGLRKAIAEILPEAAWQRCYVHFLRNALDYCRARPTTTACRSFAGSTTAETWPRPSVTWPTGSIAGRRSIPSSPTGLRRTLARRSPSTACRGCTTGT